MKKLVVAFCVISFLLCTAIPVFAAEQVKTRVLDVEVYDSFYDGMARAWSLNSAGNWLSGYFVDVNGQKCLPWDGNSDNFSEGLACNETTDGKQYFINKAGKTVFYVPDVCRVHSGYFGVSGDGFKEGRDIVCRRDNNHAVGAIDNTGKLVIPYEYWEISTFSNGYAIAAKDQKMGLIDKNGNVVIPFVYEYGEVLTDGFAFTKSSNFWSIWKKTPWWTFHEADSYAIYDTNAHLLLTDCDAPVEMDNGVIITSKPGGSTASGLSQYQYRMIDYSGKTIYTAPIGKSISSLGEGMYSLDDSYYYGQLMDSSGNLICDTEFGNIQPFSGGYAIVKDQNNKDGKFGIIDKNGALIVPYSYKLPGNASNRSSNIEEGVTALIDAATGKSVIITLPGTAAQGTAAPVTYTAVPSAAHVVIDGKEVAFDAYTINNNNYFKLRDLASALSGNEKRFDVIWNGKKNAIELASGNTAKS
jgi:hypothetical protein